MKNNNKKMSSGITLIALVVTIIVLLILAGISISMLSGDNGILQKATDAKTDTDNVQIKERIQLAELAARTYGQGELTYSKLNTELTKEFGAKGTGYNISEETENPWVVTVDKVTYEIIHTGIVQSSDESEKLTTYFNSEESHNTNIDLDNWMSRWKDNDTIGVNVSDIHYLYHGENDDNIDEYILFFGKVYRIRFSGDLSNEAYTVTMIDTDFDINNFGEYNIDGNNVLVDLNKNVYQKQDVSSVNQLGWGHYMAINLGAEYYYLNNQGEPDDERPFIGYAVRVYNKESLLYYDENGNIIDNVVFGGLT